MNDPLLNYTIVDLTSSTAFTVDIETLITYMSFTIFAWSAFVHVLMSYHFRSFPKKFHVRFFRISSNLDI